VGPGSLRHAGATGPGGILVRRRVERLEWRFQGCSAERTRKFERFVGKPNESPQGMHDRL